MSIDYYKRRIGKLRFIIERNLRELEYILQKYDDAKKRSTKASCKFVKESKDKNKEFVELYKRM